MARNVFHVKEKALAESGKLSLSLSLCLGPAQGPQLLFQLCLVVLHHKDSVSAVASFPVSHLLSVVLPPHQVSPEEEKSGVKRGKATEIVAL